jgi:hypothetical protein
VGDEPVQRVGGLEFVQKTQAARVAGRRMVGHANRRVGEQMPVRAGFAVVHENVNPASASNDSHLSSSVVDWRSGDACPP